MKRGSVSAYLHMRRDIPPPPLYAAIGIMIPTSLHQLHTYLIDVLFLNQKTYKDIRILYSLKYKHFKKKFLYEKINGGVGKNKHSG